MAVSSRYIFLSYSAAILLSSLSRAALGHRFRSRGDRLDDVVIASAAADVAVELLADGVLVEIVAAAAHDIERRHDHAGGAIAALQAVVLAERLLHRMQGPARLGQTLNGGDLSALALQGEQCAG